MYGRVSRYGLLHSLQPSSSSSYASFGPCERSRGNSGKKEGI